MVPGYGTNCNTKIHGKDFQCFQTLVIKIPFILSSISDTTQRFAKVFGENLRFYTSIATTLLQDLTQDSATLTGWRRTKRSGEGKMIALYGPGISLLRYLNFPAFLEIPEFS
jgi:hypothetical protein